MGAFEEELDSFQKITFRYIEQFSVENFQGVTLV